MKRLSIHACKLLDELSHLFGLTNYDWYTYIEKNNKEDKEGQKRSASIVIDSEYQRIYLYIYPCFFKSNPEHQRGYLLHEFCHTVTHELTEIGYSLLNGKLISSESIREANEKATSQAANLLDGLLLSSNKKARDAYKGYAKKKPVRRKRLRRKK